MFNYIALSVSVSPRIGKTFFQNHKPLKIPSGLKVNVNEGNYDSIEVCTSTSLICANEAEILHLFECSVFNLTNF